MLPVIELRGAIPVGLSLGIPMWLCYIISVAGNMLPVPFILLFIREILKLMKKVKHLDKIALWIEEKAHKKSERVLKYASLGLFVLVAIPLPGTGAWTGALVAAFLDMRMKYALPSIFAGVLAAGAVVCLICSGVLGMFDFLI